MKQLFFSILCAFTVMWVKAQPSKVSGRVTDANGKGLEGVSVVIKGTKTGTVTNSLGEFSISAPQNSQLVVSAIGYVPQEVSASDKFLEVTLKNDVSNLGEVVVVGYGTQRRASLSGSVVSLNNAALTRRQISSTSQVLQGLAPGVMVQQQSGRPGADGGTIRIRGESSILGNSNPLVIIDGMALDLAALNLIDPNAIESITVLKDAASTAIYGNRASAGVIVVKTKRATRKGVQVSYNNFVTKQEFTSLPERVSAIDHMILSNVAEQNRTGNPNATVFSQTLIDRYRNNPPNNLDIIDTDWIAEVLTNSGLMHNHNVQLSSGGEKVNVFTSFTYFDQQGLIQNNRFKKYDIRFNPEFKLNSKLTLSGVFALTNSRTINPSTGSPEFIIRQAIGLPAIGGGKYGPGMYGTAGQANNRNPIAMAEATGTSETEGNNFLSRIALSFRPVNGLELEASWGWERRNPHLKTFVKNADIYQPNLATQGYDKIGVWPGTTSLSESWRNDQYKTYLAQATYNFKWKDDHAFKFLVGGQSELFTNYFFGASRTGFVNPNQPYLNLGSGQRDNNAGASELALAGFYGRINYAFADKYLLELNGRRDGSSRFSQARNKQWGSFGSASAAWVISKENFFANVKDKIQHAKLRVSYGSNGNQNIGSNYVFDAFYETATYSNPNNGTNTYFNNVTTLGTAILQFPNPDLSWEKSNQFNVGIDLTVFKNFNITFDIFRRSLKDMILRRTLPASAGGLGNPFINAGGMENNGWELALNYKNKIGKVGLDITAMIWDVKNEVTQLVPGLPFIGDGIRTAVGQPLNSYFGYKVLGFFADSNDVKNSPVQFGTPWSSNPTQGPKPGDVKYADISGPAGKPDGIIDANDRTFIGNAFPRYEYSININLSYAGFDLNLFGQGVGKRNNFLSGTGAVPFASSDFAASLLNHHKNHWRPDNTNALFPRLLPSGFGGNNYLLSDWWIRSAAYFRLKNVNLGYTLPAAVTSKMKISSLRVFVSGQNLFTLTKSWKGFDPEINNANAEFYPVMRTYTAGLNVTF
ncbi:MAG: TonB-dependent receptor [Chitinophagaceae bacterium]|nr:TonB-dependent receptor [Chitinophagaceae bacterium]